MKLYLINFIFFLTLTVYGQQIIAFQGFEGTAQDNWIFTPPMQNPAMPMLPVGSGNYGAGYSKTGNFSCRFGGGSTTCGTGSANCINGAGSGGSCSNNLNGQVVLFNEVNVSGFTNIMISVAHRTHLTCSGSGFDAADRIFFEVQFDGANWNTIATINGNNNCIWNYNTNPVPCINNTLLNNPFEYDVPDCTNTLAFRVRILVDRTDEVFYIDDVRLTGVPGGIVFNPINIQHLDF